MITIRGIFDTKYFFTTKYVSMICIQTLTDGTKENNSNINRLNKKYIWGVLTLNLMHFKWHTRHNRCGFVQTTTPNGLVVLYKRFDEDLPLNTCHVSSFDVSNSLKRQINITSFFRGDINLHHWSIDALFDYLTTHFYLMIIFLTFY